MTMKSEKGRERERGAGKKATTKWKPTKEDCYRNKKPIDIQGK